MLDPEQSRQTLTRLFQRQSIADLAGRRGMRCVGPSSWIQGASATDF